MGDVKPETAISCNQARLPNGVIGTPSQPQNLPPTMCPVYKMCVGKVGTEIKRLANWFSLQLGYEREPTSHTINDILLCLHIGV